MEEDSEDIEESDGEEEDEDDDEEEGDEDDEEFEWIADEQSEGEEDAYALLNRAAGGAHARQVSCACCSACPA